MNALEIPPSPEIPQHSPLPPCSSSCSPRSSCSLPAAGCRCTAPSFPGWTLHAVRNKQSKRETKIESHFPWREKTLKKIALWEEFLVMKKGKGSVELTYFVFLFAQRGCHSSFTMAWKWHKSYPNVHQKHKITPLLTPHLLSVSNSAIFAMIPVKRGNPIILICLPSVSSPLDKKMTGGTPEVWPDKSLTLLTFDIWIFDYLNTWTFEHLNIWLLERLSIWTLELLNTWTFEH